MKKSSWLLIALLTATLSVGPARAAEETTPQASPAQETSVQPQTQAPAETAQAPEVKQPKCLSGIEFLSGFGWGKLRRATRNYNAVPLMVDLDFDLKPLLEKINFRPRPLVEFVVEPYASFISSPRSNAEIGTSFLIKIGFLPQTSKIQPYFKGGAGMVYISLHTTEQGSQFNFIEYGGLGLHYFFRKDTALTLEGRFRHLSNAGISNQNTGINSCFVLGGITKKF